MNNQIAINQKSMSLESVFAAIAAVVAGYLSAVNMPMEWLSRYYSNLLGEEVSVRQTRKIVLAQIAFIAMILPLGTSLIYHAVTVGLFALSLLNCRK